MRMTVEPAWILHSRPYRESSALLEALSRSHGRVGLVARGARGSRSRWKSMLQPFRPLLLSWTQRGELGTLTAAEQVAATPPLTGEGLYCGLYANELIMRFLQRADPHAGLFAAYGELLAALCGEGALQPALRQFEYRLLGAAGFGLQLDHEVGSERAIEPDGWYLYRPEGGPQRQIPGGARDEGLVSGAALLALKSGHIESAHLRELRQLMRGLIRYHLGDDAIRSQQLFS